MGNSEPIPSLQKLFPPTYSWKTIANMGSYQIVKDMPSGKYGHLYRLQLADYQSEIKYYYFRKKHQEELLAVLDVWRQGSLHMCLQNQYFNVVIEKTICTMRDIVQISFLQFFFIMQEVLNSASLIDAQYKGMHYEDSNIFINDKGRPKLWINTNSRYNKPDQQYDLTQKQIVSELFTILQCKCNSIPKLYFDSKNSFKLSTFQEAIYFIKLIQKKLNLPIISKISTNFDSRGQRYLIKNHANFQQQIKQIARPYFYGNYYEHSMSKPSKQQMPGKQPMGIFTFSEKSHEITKNSNSQKGLQITYHQQNLPKLKFNSPKLQYNQPKVAPVDYEYGPSKLQQRIQKILDRPLLEQTLPNLQQMNKQYKSLQYQLPNIIMGSQMSYTDIRRVLNQEIKIL